jgi:hypothetical protein
LPLFELNRLTSYDDDALLSELRRVAASVPSPYLTRSEFDRHSKAHSSGIARRFGGWQKALERAGLEHRFSQTSDARKAVGQKFTDDQLLAELHAVSARIGGAPVTIDAFNEHATINAETVRRRFGSWGAALKRAELSISPLGKRHSDNEYFENLLEVWTYHGRQPKYGEMDRPPSLISSGAYESKWGTWTNALLAFLDRVNSEPSAGTIPLDEPAVAVTPAKARIRSRTGRRPSAEERRQPSLALRYHVLRRDRFRCVLCGANPATSIGCVLHVDHIVPFSRGGKTTSENLRTLCQSCNLGKSARLESRAPVG